MEAEKIQVLRFQVRLPVLEINGKPAPNVLVLDIGVDGARLETDAPMANRYPVEFSLLLEKNEPPLKLFGQVAWLRPLIEKPGFFHMGVSFLQPRWDLNQRFIKMAGLTEMT
jgi:hypothetical protein